MSDDGGNVASVIWALGVTLDTSQLPSSDIEGLTHFLKMLFSFKFVA